MLNPKPLSNLTLEHALTLLLETTSLLVDTPRDELLIELQIAFDKENNLLATIIPKMIL